MIDIIIDFLFFVNTRIQCFPQFFRPEDKKTLKNLGILLSYYYQARRVKRKIFFASDPPSASAGWLMAEAKLVTKGLIPFILSFYFNCQKIFLTRLPTPPHGDKNLKTKSLLAFYVRDLTLGRQ